MAVSTDWVGLVIEAVTGMSLQDYLQANVLSRSAWLTPLSQNCPMGSRFMSASGWPAWHLPLFIGGGNLFRRRRARRQCGDYARFYPDDVELTDSWKACRFCLPKTSKQ
jgi:hypothetical protein